MGGWGLVLGSATLEDVTWRCRWKFSKQTNGEVANAVCDDVALAELHEKQALDPITYYLINVTLKTNDFYEKILEF